MASTPHHVAISEFLSFIPSFANSYVAQRQSIYEENRHRVYSLAFLMTHSELQAEQLLEETFVRAFGKTDCPNPEQIDDVLVAKLREEYVIGIRTLDCAEATEALNVRENTKRVHLEAAVMELPATEKLVFLMHDVEGYEHARIVRTLGISTHDAKHGLHQARLRIRELVSKMAW